MYQVEAIGRLAAELPRFSEVEATSSLSDQARAVLSWVIVHAVANASSVIENRKSAIENAELCPNCDTPTNSLRSPYCSDCCREEAAFVRQVRSGLAESSIFDSERQVALGQKLWRLLGGGYPLRISLIPEKTMVKTIERKGGRCETCGAPATTVDNVGSG